MRYYLAMIWLLWFVAFRCVQNEKVKGKNLGTTETFSINEGLLLDTSLLNGEATELKTSEFKVYNDKPERLFLVYRIDTSEYIEIADSSGVLAYWHKDKWEVNNCEKALDVMVYTVNYLQEQINQKQNESALNAKYTKQ